MPTTTWERLPAARRDRVLDAAIAEFAAHGFSGGSLNVIAREADIAKGSLFQYFDDKQELYEYVCDVVSERVRIAVQEQLAQVDQFRPFFDVWLDLMRIWTAYFRDHALERGVALATHLEIDPQVRVAVRGVSGRHFLMVLRPMLDEARARGDLRDDADTDVLAEYLVLLLPHLALTPFEPGLDRVLVRPTMSARALDAALVRLIEPLRLAFEAQPDNGKGNA